MADLALSVWAIIPNRFHNLSREMLADLFGQLDKQAKAANAEMVAAMGAFKTL